MSLTWYVWCRLCVSLWRVVSNSGVGVLFFSVTVCKVKCVICILVPCGDLAVCCFSVMLH